MDVPCRFIIWTGIGKRLVKHRLLLNYCKKRMRAVVENGAIHAFGTQDSSLLSILTRANALLIRPPHDGARSTGEAVPNLPI